MSVISLSVVPLLATCLHLSVSWRSILQSTIALSTNEAKHMVVTEAIREAKEIYDLIKELRIH
jgi:hypothetical protein